MKSVATDSPARFYFALPRLAAKCFGESSRRAARSSFETHFASVMIFVITWLFAWRVYGPAHSVWMKAAALLLLIPASFIGWLVALALHWLLIRAAQSIGLWRDRPPDRVQGIFIIAETSAFAAVLVKDAGWPATIGEAWLIGVALNLASAVLLALIDGSSRRPAI